MLRRSRLGLVAGWLLLGACHPGASVKTTDKETLGLAALAAADGALREGRTEEAARLYGDLAASHMDSVRAARGLQDATRTLEAEGPWRARYEAAARDRPSDALAWYLLGRTQVSEPERAKAAWNRAIELDPTLAWPVIGLAYLHASRGDLYAAVQEYKKGLERAPRSGVLHLSLASQYLDLRLFVDAERELDAARVLLPGDPEVEAGLAKLWAVSGEVDRALPVLEGLRREHPGMGDILPTLASLYLQQRQVEKASDTYGAALALGVRPDPGLAASIRAARIVERSSAPRQ